MRLFVTALAGAALVAGSAQAQLGKKLAPTAGPGKVINVQQILTAATGSTFNGCLGVTYDPNIGSKQGTFWVSSRRPTTTQPHYIHEIGFDGKYRRSIKAPAKLSASSWGFRDGTTDWQKKLLLWSAENAATGNTVFAFDPAGQGTWKTAENWKVPANSPSTTTRALTYVPPGQRTGQNAPTLVTANFSSNWWEFDKSGRLLRSGSSVQRSAYGVGYDLTTKTLCWWGQSGSTRTPTVGVVGRHQDYVTGQQGTTMFIGDPQVAGSRAGGVAGGFEIGIFNADGKGPKLQAIALTQASSDSVYVLDCKFLLARGCDGKIATAGDAAYRGNSNWAITLRGAPAGVARAALGLGVKGPAINVPPLKAGCNWHLDLRSAVFPFGLVAVTGGGAQQNIPIPASLAASGTIAFQWVTVDLAKNGLGTSDAGHAEVGL